MKCNSISKSSLLLLSLLLTVAGAHAQTAARANVPFAFKVGTTQMPAGTYAIRNDAGSSVVLVRNLQIGTSALAQGCTGQLTTVEVERFTGNLPPIQAYDPPVASQSGIASKSGAADKRGS